MAQFKRCRPDFLFSFFPDNIFMELRLPVNTSINLLSLVQTTDWMVGEHSGPQM